MASGYGTYGGRSYGFAEPGGYPVQQRLSSEHSILRSGGVARSGPPRARARVNIWELIFVPWMFLVLILVCYLLAGAHGKVAVLWTVPIVLISLSATFINWHYKMGNNAEVVLGLLCITAVVIGLVVGVYSTVKSLSEYRRLSLGANYFNVLPTEPAAGRADGTLFVFTNDTLVDQSRAFGFTDIFSSAATLYCVAPITDGEGSAKVQYWAAGTNCCQSRGDFKCGDVGSPIAHGALMLPQAVQHSAGFKAAVTGAESAYSIKADENYVLLKWAHNPVAYRDSLWSSTVALFAIFAGVYFAISAMIGCSLMPVIAMK